MENNQAHILIVDDEILNLEIVEEYLDDIYQTTTAEDGEIAWKILEESPSNFDAILLDRMMPNMDGLEVLKRIKEHPILQHCPVIFQTAKAGASHIAEGMNAGAYYYLTKPFEEEILLSVIKTAVNDHTDFMDIQKSLEQNHQTMGLLTSATFKFKTLDDARSIASLLSNACPEPSSIIMGLTELMINAIEHGNLGITYKEKSTLNSNGTWEKEVQNRLERPEYKNKAATITFHRDSSTIKIIITDEGQGFDFQTYMDFDPNRIMDNHGRGIAIANKLSFSSIKYQGTGNTVVACVQLTP